MITPSSLTLPCAVQLVLDDVGWREGWSLAEEGGPWRAGVNRLLGVEDYAAVAQLGEPLGPARNARWSSVNGTAKTSARAIRRRRTRGRRGTTGIAPGIGLPKRPSSSCAGQHTWSSPCTASATSIGKRATVRAQSGMAATAIAAGRGRCCRGTWSASAGSWGSMTSAPRQGSPSHPVLCRAPFATTGMTTTRVDRALMHPAPASPDLRPSPRAPAGGPPSGGGDAACSYRPRQQRRA